MDKSERGKLLFDESTNVILRKRKNRQRLFLASQLLFITFSLFFLVEATFFTDSVHICSALPYMIGVFAALILIIGITGALSSVTFIKIYENGLVIPEGRFWYPLRIERFVPFSKIKYVYIREDYKFNIEAKKRKAEGVFRIANGIKIEIMNGILLFSDDLERIVIDTDRFIDLLELFASEGKIVFKKKEVAPLK